MKHHSHIRVNTLAVAAVFGLSTLGLSFYPLSVNAQSSNANAACEKRVALFRSLKEEIKTYNKNHFKAPKDDHIQYYSEKNTKMLTGDMYTLRNAVGNVPVFINGTLVGVDDASKRKKRVNYGIQKENYDVIRIYAGIKMENTSSFKAYTKSIEAMGDKLKRAQTIAEKKADGWNAGTIDCNTNQGRKRALELSKSRSTHMKELKSELKSVQSANKAVLADYKKLSKEFKQKNKPQRKPAPSNNAPVSGGDS